MEKIIVYLDDAAYAQQQLAPMAGAAGWRAKWADKLFRQIGPYLAGRGDRFTTVLATGPLPELTKRLAAEHSTSRVLDARPVRGRGTGAILRP